MPKGQPVEKSQLDGMKARLHTVTLDESARVQKAKVAREGMDSRLSDMNEAFLAQIEEIKRRH